MSRTSARPRIAHALTALVAAVMLVLAAWRPPSARACGDEQLEIVFVLDCSGSMSHTLNTLQEQIRRIGEALEGQVRGLRIGVVIFRTAEYQGKLAALEVLPFTTDRDQVAAFLNRQAADGGGDELVDKALDRAVTEMGWSKGARKVALLMGDEEPRGGRRENCLGWAKEMKKRGIVLHALTASQTAWIYWAPLHMEEWTRRQAALGADAKRRFELPFFKELAEQTGGLSVSSFDSRDLVLWVLAFGLGLNKEEARTKLDLDKFFEWSRRRAQDEASLERPAGEAQSGAEPLLARVKYKGAWDRPRRLGRILPHLEQQLALAGPPTVETVTLVDPQLERHPVLILSGTGAFKWSFAEQENLQKHLRSGGFVFAHACQGDKAFDASLRAQWAEMFPHIKLTKLPPDHALYRCGHEIKKVVRREDAAQGAMTSRAPELWGLSLPDAVTGKERLAVVYSPLCLGSSWRSRPLSVPCTHDNDDGLKLTANVLVWALTR